MIHKSIKNPRAAGRYFLDKIAGRSLPKDFDWAKDERTNLRTKKYQSYDEYVRHQSTKLGRLDRDWIANYDARYYAEL